MVGTPPRQLPPGPPFLDQGVYGDRDDGGGGGSNGVEGDLAPPDVTPPAAHAAPGQDQEALVLQLLQVLSLTQTSQ